MCPLFRMPPLDCCYPVCFACIIRGFSLRLYISTKSSPGFSTRIVNTRPFQSNPIVSNKAQNSFRTQFEPDRFQATFLGRNSALGLPWLWRLLPCCSRPGIVQNSSRAFVLVTNSVRCDDAVCCPSHTHRGRYLDRWCS